jgi:chitinase
LLRRRNPNLKLLLSIGGWTYSGDLATAVSVPDKHRMFVQSSVALLRQFHLDGIDIDWEYPQNDTQAVQYVELLRDFRLELDSEALRNNLPRRQFELSVACPAGLDQMQKLRIAEMDRYLSFWNVMAYDFSGSWSQKTDYHSNLFGGVVNADMAIRYYMSKGVVPRKIVLGMPIYGRAFVGTDGLNHSYGSIGEGSWEKGVWDYKDLPLNGAEERVDRDRVAAYCYSSSTKTLVVYDNPDTIQRKAQYIVDNDLGGGMWWESSADKPVNDTRSLVNAFSSRLGSQGLEQRPNCLNIVAGNHTEPSNITGGNGNDTFYHFPQNPPVSHS